MISSKLYHFFQIYFTFTFLSKIKKEIQMRFSSGSMRSSSFCFHFNKETETSQNKMTNKCNQCDYASPHVAKLRTHLNIHSGDKPNQCNQCDFASSWASALIKHLKIHSGQKSNKCNQCDYESIGKPGHGMITSLEEGHPDMTSLEEAKSYLRLSRK